MKSKLLILISTALLFSSCAQDSLTGDAYSRGEAGMAQSVHMGRITSIRPVQIEGGNETGSLLGAVAGGLLGSQLGGGHTAHTAGAIGGVLAGSALGSHAQKSMSSRNGLEITVKLDRGDSVSVVQEFSPRDNFTVGSRVRVLSNGGRTRVSR
jgi:outer membrane lipoprotein SlyB